MFVFSRQLTLPIEQWSVLRRPSETGSGDRTREYESVGQLLSVQDRCCGDNPVVLVADKRIDPVQRSILLEETSLLLGGHPIAPEPVPALVRWPLHRLSTPAARDGYLPIRLDNPGARRVGRFIVEMVDEEPVERWTVSRLDANSPSNMPTGFLWIRRRLAGPVTLAVFRRDVSEADREELAVGLQRISGTIASARQAVVFSDEWTKKRRGLAA